MMNAELLVFYLLTLKVQTREKIPGPVMLWKGEIRMKETCMLVKPPQLPPFVILPYLPPPMSPPPLSVM